MNWLRQHKHLVLLLTLLCAFLVQSASHGLLAARVISNLFISVIVLAVLLIVFEHRHHRIIAILLALAVILSGWIHYALASGEFDIILGVVHYLLLSAFLGYTVAVILGNIFRRSAVEADDVLGAISGYIIAGAAWSSLYALTFTLLPDAFTLAPGFGGQMTDWPGRTAVFNYFSLVTLTTMGYGDITPVRGPATAFAVIEAVFGQFYIAVVVAQLVGARMSNSTRQEPGES